MRFQNTHKSIFPERMLGIPEIVFLHTSNKVKYSPLKEKKITLPMEP